MIELAVAMLMCGCILVVRNRLQLQSSVSLSMISEYERKLRQIEAELEQQRASNDKARKAIHDMMAPLYAMKTGKKKSSDKRNIELIRRAESIAAEILPEKALRKANPTCNPVKVVQAVVRDMSIDKLIRLSCAVDENTLMAVEADDFSRILVNLFSNSIEASASFIDVRVHASETQFEIAISNDGSPIPVEVLRELRQCKQVTTKSFGSGLGVSSVRDIVSTSGGEFDIGVEDNQTVVRIKLPIARPCPKIYIPNFTKALVYATAEDEVEFWSNQLASLNVAYKIFANLDELQKEQGQLEVPSMVILCATSAEVAKLDLTKLSGFPKYLISPDSETENKSFLDIIPKRDYKHLSVHVIDQYVILDDEQLTLKLWSHSIPVQSVSSKELMSLDGLSPDKTFVFLDNWIGDVDSSGWRDEMVEKGFSVFSISGLKPSGCPVGQYLGKRPVW